MELFNYLYFSCQKIKVQNLTASGVLCSSGGQALSVHPWARLCGPAQAAVLLCARLSPGAPCPTHSTCTLGGVGDRLGRNPDRSSRVGVGVCLSCVAGLFSPGHLRCKRALMRPDRGVGLKREEAQAGPTDCRDSLHSTLCPTLAHPRPSKARLT